MDPEENKAAEAAAAAAPAEEVKSAETPEELGGHLTEGGQFEADFDSIIDGLAPKDAKDGAETATAAPAKEEPAKADPEKAEAAAEEPAKTDAKADAPAADAAAAATAANTRDADLRDLESKLDPHSTPRTKDHFKAQGALIVEARDKLDATAKRLQQVESELAEVRKGGLPKEITEELTQLRDTVRELDATRDPALIAKYDKKISGNDDAIIAILKDNGFGLEKDTGKEVPGVIEALRKAGITRRTLDDKITALEKAGQHEAAEEIKDLLRENSRLSRDREAEIGTLKSTYEQRQKTASETQAREIEAANKRMQDTFSKEVGKFDFLKEPPAVKPEDTPAIRKEKEKAISAANERVLRFAEAVKKECATPIDAQIAARTGILYRDHVVPKLQADLAAKDQEIAKLQTRIKAMQGAGDISKKPGSSKPSAPPPEEVDISDGFDDAIDKMAKAAGVRK